MGTVTIVTGGMDRKRIILVDVLLLVIVSVGNVDFGVFMKSNKDGGVGTSTTIFAIHLESPSCATEIFVYILQCMSTIGIGRYYLKKYSVLCYVK